MANPATTHVIEIVTGIGEPAFIPLSMGHELQPISVGKKGMWRIESARVLDVHAFVYFDGNALFLQSADEQSAASVDGFRVGKAWTELHAPCQIEIGMARLRFRSLAANAEPPTIGTSPAAQQGAAGPPQGAPPAAASGSLPASFPKADRPFRPGEFASKPDDESTRVAPLDSSGANRAAGTAVQPRPAAGSPADAAMRSGAVPAVTGGPGFPQMGPHGSMPPGGMMGGPGTVPIAMQPPGYPPQGPYGAPGPGYPGSMPPNPMAATALASGPYAPIGGPQGMPPGNVGPSMPPGGFGSMTPQGGMQKPPQGQGGNDILTKLKETPIPMKAVAMTLIAIAAALFLLDDDEPQPVKKKKPVATLDGGAADGGKVAAGGGPPPVVPPVGTPTVPAATTAMPAWPPGVPCPPPNWPAGTPLPCTPNNVTATTAATTTTPPEKGGKDAGEKGGKDKDAGALPPGTKTLERQAVDYVAAGETAKAAAAYEELARRDPKTTVYAEAARILRAKLDGGAP